MAFLLISLVLRMLWLERAFEESKVFMAVKALNGDKAPDLESFSLDFFQTCWRFLKMIS
jgi:hypothetical protein